MKLKQIFVIAIIAMFLLVPFASAKQEVADNSDIKQDKKIDEKITDKTKESAKEITSKDKDIKGKVTVTDSDSSKYTVEKKSKTEISISKAKGEHTKSKVAFAKEDLQKIDVDGDQLYGVLHIADDGSTSHDVYTESQLTSGTEMIFSENVVNGFSGYTEKTQTGVTSGTIIDIPDVSGSDYYVTTSVSGTVPTYTAGIPTSGLWGKYTLDEGTGSVAHDTSGNNRNLTFQNATWTTDTTGGSALVFNGFTKAPIDMGTLYALSVYVEHKPTNTTTTKRIFSQSTTSYGARIGLYSNSAEQNTGAARNASSTLKTATDTVQYPNNWIEAGATFNNSSINLYRNGIGTVSTSMVTPITASYSASASWIGNGFVATGFSEPYVGSIGKMYLYSTKLSNAGILQCYADGSGISFKPQPSYNWTGYDVASTIEKLIDTDSACTGIEYVDTTGGTHTVTVRVYFTEDITKTTETKGAIYQNVSIIHTKQNATASVGSIAYELDPLYSGDPVLTSNNTNATASRNDTHVIISTGLVKQGQSFSYAVSVPDSHNHGFHLGDLMQWVGTGWDFVSTAPEDWNNYIGDQIEVTVS